MKKGWQREGNAAREIAVKRSQKHNRAWFDGVSDDMMEELERTFDTRSMIRRGSDGRVDPNATLAANGAFEVISWIKQRRKLGSQGK